MVRAEQAETKEKRESARGETGITEGLQEKISETIRQVKSQLGNVKGSS